MYMCVCARADNFGNQKTITVPLALELWAFVSCCRGSEPRVLVLWCISQHLSHPLRGCVRCSY